MRPDPSRPGGVGAEFIEAVARHPDRLAILGPDERWTYRDLLEAARTNAAALKRAGLKPGNVLGLRMDDGIEFLGLFLGAAIAGITAAIFTPGVRPTYLAPHLSLLEVDLFIASGEEGRGFLAMLPEAHRLAGKATPPTLHVEEAGYRDLFQDCGSLTGDVTDVALPLDQAAIVVFTSGLTGPPKSCWISHRNLLCKVDPLAQRFELSRESRLWIGVGMYQIGFISPFLTAMMTGACVVLTTGLPPDRKGSYLGETRVTHAYPIYLSKWLPIIGDPAFTPSDLLALSHVCLVGPISALRRAQRALPQAVVMNTYGSPEEGGAICMPRVDDTADIRLGTSGKPFPGHDVRIVDPKTNLPMLQGAVGEIQVRGPGVPLPRPDTDFGSRFTADGWLRTSDLGVLRSGGALLFRGRLAEMLKIGEETVSALDIETVLLMHRDIAVAQVIARRDPKLGEVAAAFVELRPGASVGAEKLIAFCSEHLPPNHVPRYLRIMDSWPTSSSKIYKPSLADMPLGRRLVP